MLHWVYQDSELQARTRDRTSTLDERGPPKAQGVCLWRLGVGGCLGVFLFRPRGWLRLCGFSVSVVAFRFTV